MKNPTIFYLSIHYSIYPSINLSIHPSINLSIHPYINLSIQYTSIYQSIYPSSYPPSTFLSNNQSVCLFIIYSYRLPSFDHPAEFPQLCGGIPLMVLCWLVVVSLRLVGQVGGQLRTKSWFELLLMLLHMTGRSR